MGAEEEKLPNRSMKEVFSDSWLSALRWKQNSTLITWQEDRSGGDHTQHFWVQPADVCLSSGGLDICFMCFCTMQATKHSAVAHIWRIQVKFEFSFKHKCLYCLLSTRKRLLTWYTWRKNSVMVVSLWRNIDQGLCSTDWCYCGNDRPWPSKLEYNYCIGN